MKRFRYILSLMLVVFCMMSVVVLPAFALSYLNTTHYNLVKDMSPLCYNIGSDSKEKVKALQRYLMCFDNECKALLYYNGQYMDGDFGGRTKAAAIYCQKQLGLDTYYQTGYVGPTTWTAIADDLGCQFNQETSNGNTYILKRWTGTSSIYLTGWDSVNRPALFYYPESGYGNCVYFTS